MTHPEESARRELVEGAHALHARGWVANHDGNVTVRLGPGRFLATPTSTSKAHVTPESLIVVDDQGAVVQGTRRSFTEVRLHLVAYAARPDVQAVVHAHPPTATGFAVAGVELGEPFMAEPVVSLGARVPLVPFGLPTDPALHAALARALALADVAMLANHGVLAVGPDVTTCLLRIELVEHLCRVALVARQLGGPVPLPNGLVQELTAMHQRPAASPAHTPPTPDRAPEAHVTAASVTPSSAAADRVVAEALARFRR